MDWTWVLIILGICIIGYCIWSYNRIEPFENPPTTTYTMIDLSGETLGIHKAGNRALLTKIYDGYAKQIDNRVIHLDDQINKHRNQIYEWENEGGLTNAQGKKELTINTCLDGVGKNRDACRNLKWIVSDVYPDYKLSIQENKLDAKDKIDMYNAMLEDGPINFITDYANTTLLKQPPLQRDLDTGFVINEAEFELGRKAPLSDYETKMTVYGSLTDTNRTELTRNAEIAKNLWLSEPKNLELYIFVDDASLIPYMRIGSAPTPVDKSPEAKAAAQATIDTLRNGVPDNVKLANRGYQLVYGSDHYITDRYILGSAKADDFNTARGQIALQNSPDWTPSTKCKPIFTERTESSGSITYDISSAAVSYNRAFCNRQITPELLSLLPPPTNTFITEYIRRRVKRVAQFTLQTNSEYTAAFTKFKGYLTDICGASNELSSRPLQTRINAWGSNANQKALFTRMILEKKSDLDVISDTDLDYTYAKEAYDKYKAAVAKDPNVAVIMDIDVSSKVVDPLKRDRTLDAAVTKFLYIDISGMPVKPAPPKKSEGYLGTMIIRNKSDINVSSTDASDYAAAQAKYILDMQTITGDTIPVRTIKSKTIPLRASDRGPSPFSLESAYLIIMIYSYELGLPNAELCNINPQYFRDQHALLMRKLFAGTLLPIATQESIASEINNTMFLTAPARKTILDKIPGVLPFDERNALLTNIKNRQDQRDLLESAITGFNEIKSEFAALANKPSGAALNTWVTSRVRGSAYPLVNSYIIMMLLTAASKIEPFREPAPILATKYFNTREPNIRALIDQIATQYYVHRGGVEAISYVYEIFPIGSSILDLRCEIMSYAAGVADAAKNEIKSLNEIYLGKLNKNLSVNQQNKLIEFYEADRAKIRDELEAKRIRTVGLRRIFYTLTKQGNTISKITVNGVTAENVTAGSYYMGYNCGIDIPMDDTPGSIEYEPINVFSLNDSIPFNHTNPSMLRQIGLDYITAMTAGDLSGALTRLPNGPTLDRNGRPTFLNSKSLQVTKILGIQKLDPYTCNLQWEETMFDYISNKPDPPIVRNVTVPYMKNTTDWYDPTILFDYWGFEYLPAKPDGMTLLTTPIHLPPPYIDDATLDNGEICPKVMCSTKETLYKLIEEYNADDTKEGFILRVIKSITMNSGQCDLLVDMDYSSKKGGSAKTGVIRERVALSVGLDIPTCKHFLARAEPGYGIEDTRPLFMDSSGASGEYDFIDDFNTRIFSEISNVTRVVTDQISSVYETAKGALTNYRLLTYSNAGGLPTLEGCTNVRCSDPSLMNSIMQYVAKTRGGYRVNEIMTIGKSASKRHACDFTYKSCVGATLDSSGKVICPSEKVELASVQFTPRTNTAYIGILDATIAKINATAGLTNAARADQIQDVERVKARVLSTPHCSFDVSNVTVIDDPSWDMIQNMTSFIPSASKRLLGMPDRIVAVNHANPFTPMMANPNFGSLPPLTNGSACFNELMANKERLKLGFVYNGLLRPFDIMYYDTNRYEIRITDDTFLPFADTFKLASLYADDSCNPYVKEILESPRADSKLSPPVGFTDAAALTAVRTYVSTYYSKYIDDSQPERRLGPIRRGIYDSGIYYYEVTMGEYDADGNVLNFYGYPQDATTPRPGLEHAILACDIKRGFNAGDPYSVSYMYILKKSPIPIPTGNTVSDTSPPLPDPFETMTSYKYLEFTPLAIKGDRYRATPNKCQLMRVEFYAGNSLQKVTGDVSGELFLGPGLLQSVIAFGALFKNDGQIADLSGERAFVSPIGTPLIAYSKTPIRVDGLSFMTGPSSAYDVTRWKLRGSLTGKFWKPLFESPDPSQSKYLDYRSYETYPSVGYWRVGILAFTPNSITPLPQNATRPKCLTECVSDFGIQSIITKECVRAISASIYTSSKGIDPDSSNVNRESLKEISTYLIDNDMDAVYLDVTINTLSEKYEIQPTSRMVVLTYDRWQNYLIRLPKSIRKSGANDNPLSVFTSPPPRISFTASTLPQYSDKDPAPYGWTNYPAILAKEYEESTRVFEGGAAYSLTSFISNGPTKDMVTLPTPMSGFTSLSAEGAAQMCKGNTDCIGFDISGFIGSFYGLPDSKTKMVLASGSSKKTYFKKGLVLTTYIRIKNMRPASGSIIALNKIGLYNGSVPQKPVVASIKNAGGATTVFNSEPENLFNDTSNGWQSVAGAGLDIIFSTPMIITGYTFVTSNTISANPVSWTIETSLDGQTWRLFDTKTNIGTPKAPLLPYPLFQPGKEDGVSTDFGLKSLSECSVLCNNPMLLTNMAEALRITKGIEANALKIFINSVGDDRVNNRCFVGWDNASGISQINSFIMTPSLGINGCANVIAASNIKVETTTPQISSPLTIIGLQANTFKYIRFKPLSGVGYNLASLFILKDGEPVVPKACVDTAGNDNGSAINLIDTSLTTEWTTTGNSNIVMTFETANTTADRFTMITGSFLNKAPTRWIVESSIDGVLWSLLHEQSVAFVAPSSVKTQYPLFSLIGGPPTVSSMGVLDKSISDAGKSCSDGDIINMVNDAAFALKPPIFFNPVSYTYTKGENQCNYLQGNDGSVLRASFKTTVPSNVGGTLATIVKSVERLTNMTLTGATTITSGLKSEAECKTSCDDATLLNDMDAFYKNTNINTTKNPLAAKAYGYDAAKNECLFELDSMFAPLDANNQPVTQRVGFYVKPKTACNVPRTDYLAINTNPSAVPLTAAAVSGPYRFIRFRVSETRGPSVPVKIGGFDFFKGGQPVSYTGATITNPLGSNGAGPVNPASWSDSNRKPLQFAFSPGLDFDAYSWTTSSVGSIGVDLTLSDPKSWTLQASTNGILWKDIDTRTGVIAPVTRGFKMPIYTIGVSSTTARDTTVLQAAGNTLQDRGISCNTAATWGVAKAYYTGTSPVVADDPLSYRYDNTTNTCVYEFTTNVSGGFPVTKAFEFARESNPSVKTVVVSKMTDGGDATEEYDG